MSYREIHVHAGEDDTEGCRVRYFDVDNVLGIPNITIIFYTQHKFLTALSAQFKEVDILVLPNKEEICVVEEQFHYKYIPPENDTTNNHQSG